MPEWLSISGFKDSVLFLLALYGAVLSTFNWRQALRRDRRQLKVEMSTAMPTYMNGHLGARYAVIRATNVGQRPVTIDTLNLGVPGGKTLSPMSHDNMPGTQDTRLPVTLTDGQSAHLYMSYYDIGHALAGADMLESVMVTPRCKDTAGNVYEGKPWNVVADDFCK